MSKRVLSSTPFAPYQQLSHRLVVSELTDLDVFAPQAKTIFYSIEDQERQEVFSSTLMITPKLAIDIVHALDAHHEDGRQLGRIEKTAEIRKVLEIHS